jgi:RNA polymerase sigma-70 factor, ECF subfamily
MAVAPSDAESRSTERQQATATAASGSDAPGLAADVALAAAGDRSAFERVYRAHCDRVYSVCVRMTADAAQAEELTQDTFVRAWAKMGQFRGESSFSTWLHRLAVNVVLNAHKGEGRKRRLISMTENEDDDDAGNVGATLMAPSHFAPGEWMDIEAAIASLPPGARRVFVLHDVEGYRHEEIGTMLGITSGGSKAQLHRARMLLREALNR